MCMALQVTLDPACLRMGYLVPVVLAVRLSTAYSCFVVLLVNSLLVRCVCLHEISSLLSARAKYCKAVHCQ